MCSAGFSFALWFVVFYSQLVIRKSMEKDIAYARRPVEGFEFAAWKFFKTFHFSTFGHGWKPSLRADPPTQF